MTRLPDILIALLGSADENAVLSFLDASGGQQISVPRNAAGSRLEHCFGPEIAQALVNWSGGETISIPQCRVWRIHKLADRGLRRNEIALRVGVTTRRVSMVLAEQDAPSFSHPARQRDTRQMDIMDFLYP